MPFVFIVQLEKFDVLLVDGVSLFKEYVLVGLLVPGGGRDMFWVGYQIIEMGNIYFFMVIIHPSKCCISGVGWICWWFPAINWSGEVLYYVPSRGSMRSLEHYYIICTSSGFNFQPRPSAVSFTTLTRAVCVGWHACACAYDWWRSKGFRSTNG